MTGYESFLAKLPLFHGFSQDQLEHLLNCFSPLVKQFEKGSFILLSGYENHFVHILLSGEIEASKSVPSGESIIITHMGPGGVFGDVLSGSNLLSPVTISAQSDCTVLLLPYEKIISPCARLCPEHSLLIRNLLASISDKYFSLNRRIDLLLLKSLRAKLCVWLLESSSIESAHQFYTPLSRSELADYLNCERSALSRELSRMRTEGLIDYHRGSFAILNRTALQKQSQGGFGCP